MQYVRSILILTRKPSTQVLVFGLYIFILVYLFLYVSVVIFPHTIDDITEEDDTVVLILGTSSLQNGKLNQCLVSRIQAGNEIYTSTNSTMIVLSGAKNKYEKLVEAETMKTILLSYRSFDDKIIIEDQATSTYENIAFTKKMVDGQNHLVIVSEPFHLLRASLVARKMNLYHSLYKTTNSPCWKSNNISTFYSWKLLREPIGIMYYFLTGKI